MLYVMCNSGSDAHMLATGREHLMVQRIGFPSECFLEGNGLSRHHTSDFPLSSLKFGVVFVPVLG